MGDMFKGITSILQLQYQSQMQSGAQKPFSTTLIPPHLSIQQSSLQQPFYAQPPSQLAPAQQMTTNHPHLFQPYLEMTAQPTGTMSMASLSSTPIPFQLQESISPPRRPIDRPTGSPPQSQADQPYQPLPLGFATPEQTDQYYRAIQQMHRNQQQQQQKKPH